MKKLKSLLTTGLASLMVYTGLCVPISAKEANLFDGEHLRVEIEDSTIKVLDKDINEEAVIELLDDKSASVSTKDEKIIVDYSVSTNSQQINLGESASPNFDPSKLSYTYFQTTYYNTKTQGDIQNLAITLLSFLPYVGSVIAIAGAIEACRNLGAPVMYVKVDEYYAQGYQFYKYVSYFYSNSSMTNLVKTTVEYKQMW